MAVRAAARRSAEVRSARPDLTACTTPVTSRAGEPDRKAPNAWCSFRLAYFTAALRSLKRCAASADTRRTRLSSRLRYFAEARIRRVRSSASSASSACSACSASSACDSAMLATAVLFDEHHKLLAGQAGPALLPPPPPGQLGEL